MKKLLPLFLALSLPAFAESAVQCRLTVAAPGAAHSDEIAKLPLTVGRYSPALQKIGSWGGLDFSLRFHDSAALGPYDSVGIVWTDGKNTYEAPQFYLPGVPVMLMVNINGAIGTVYAACSGPAPLP
jgi:hypothetical protein